ncbi:hypothetical protein PLICRDRAFT_57732 [Plicaturopsis crispa FD-325 SS-3]|uniref:Uncharacterized protein n=1 Tax=Plicaturopsis crispa FD-325 SS-3 TaxID=944288 RepID=A0A0C9T4T1_PLICR|nr:hypothetical protein PLICRDRAFT_57732 [Plicaturopsis crispa FD-325 SS-3]
MVGVGLFITKRRNASQTLLGGRQNIPGFIGFFKRGVRDIPPPCVIEIPTQNRMIAIPVQQLPRYTGSTSSLIYPAPPVYFPAPPSYRKDALEGDAERNEVYAPPQGLSPATNRTNDTGLPGYSPGRANASPESSS